MTAEFSWSHLLYRLYDRQDSLLYVGRTNDMKQRFKQHSRSQPWWTDVARSAVETFPDLPSLCAAEKAAIIGERPKHNKVYNGRFYSANRAGVLPAWLGISPRLTAAADARHESCRADLFANYGGDVSDDPPCEGCAIEALAVASAIDRAVAGEPGADIEIVREAVVHEVNQRSIFEAKRSNGVVSSGPPSWAGRCLCEECAEGWGEIQQGLWALVE